MLRDQVSGAGREAGRHARTRGPDVRPAERCQRRWESHLVSMTSWPI